MERSLDLRLDSSGSDEVSGGMLERENKQLTVYRSMCRRVRNQQNLPTWVQQVDPLRWRDLSLCSVGC